MKAAVARPGAVPSGEARRVYGIMAHRRLYLAWGVLVVAVTVAAVAWKGFRLGIDFTGGALLERTFERPVTARAIHEALTSRPLQDLDLGGAVVQVTRDGRTALIRTGPVPREAIGRIDRELQAAVGPIVADRSRTEVVGPVIGRELVNQALLAVVAAVGGILVYVTLRFEYRFGIAAILALVHDVLVMLTLFALGGLEVNVALVAAVLTVVGYSINDTIVVFDRIREKLTGPGRRVDYARLADEAITETLPRTINTAGTTLVVVLALLFLGGRTIREFMLALFVGIASGTLSSIFVAGAIWVAWREFEARRRPPARAATSG